MNRKKPDITQEICDQVKFLIKGGATNRKAGRFVGLSATTVSRIRTADYNAEQYRKNNEIRNAEEKGEYKLTDPDLPILNRFEKKAGSYACGFTGECELPEPGIMLTEEGPVIREELQATGDQVPGQMKMFFQGEGKPPIPIVDETKLMRFLAGKTGEITTKLDKINDNLCQILRRMDK